MKKQILENIEALERHALTELERKQRLNPDDLWRAIAHWQVTILGYCNAMTDLYAATELDDYDILEIEGRTDLALTKVEGWQAYLK